MSADDADDGPEPTMTDEPPVSPEISPQSDDADDGLILQNIVILPPLQKTPVVVGRDELADAVPLPPVRSDEMVSSLRAFLGDVCGYAHLTNYRLVLEEEHAESKKKKDKSSPFPLISPYTGPNAVVSVPVAAHSLEEEPQPVRSTMSSSGDGASTKDLNRSRGVVLDDFGDLASLLDMGLKDGSAVRIVLERYDVAMVRDHVLRVRSLLDGNAPVASVHILSDATPKPEGTKEEGQSGDDNTTSEDLKTEEEKPTKEVHPFPNIPSDKIILDGTNLQDFFYLACGEEDMLYDDGAAVGDVVAATESKSKKKRTKKKKKDGDKHSDEEDHHDSPVALARHNMIRSNELDEIMRVECTIRFSGFHPPPVHRRLMGDLCYLEVVPPGDTEAPLYITAVPTGFYVNRSSGANGRPKFDPSPASDPCFSHELLDCLLQASSSLRVAWSNALAATKERAEITAASSGNGFTSLHRVAVRGDFRGYTSPTTVAAAHGLDAVVFRPTWLVPLPKFGGGDTAWTHNGLHQYNEARMEENISSFFGLDIRSGSLRDWNEELQTAREMPSSSLAERVNRARLINKVSSDFGEACLVGVHAIFDGHVSPMNPNEPTRSHVYLHNSIFFSRAIDAGVETFKMARGDRAARKAAARDINCISMLHQMDVANLNTLATVLIDYLGTRFVCQSIVPGILHGEKTHKQLYGTVESSSPLAYDEDMHELMDETLGSILMIATRSVPTIPLNDERLAVIEGLRTPLPFGIEPGTKKETENTAPTTKICGPIEGKGIRGSDQRNYLLDLNRLSPRDANWVPKSEGGTGNWEKIEDEHASPNGEGISFIPPTLDDDEWTMAVLRHELVSAFTTSQLAKYREKNKSTANEKDTGGNKTDENTTSEANGVEEPTDEASATVEENNDVHPKLSPDEEAYLKSLRLNINVFLPDLRPLEDMDAAATLQADTECVSAVAFYLWDNVLPQLTQDVREGRSGAMAMDGAHLTDILHQRGINCRYLGRLATLAAAEEASDAKAQSDLQKGELSTIGRRKMPPYWLELIECEMVARSAKHTLDAYLLEMGGAAAKQPAQTIASFLSALVSTAEETAGDTENRMIKQDRKFPDEDDINALSIAGIGGDGDGAPMQVRGRKEVWEDIERDIGRRFRYRLSLFNQSSRSSRATFVSLLRRVCRRSGIRLVARQYEIGGKCLCSSGSNVGGELTVSYPISPLDVIGVVPLIKHAAAQNGGSFVSCSSVIPPLRILLPDAVARLEAAQKHFVAKNMPAALELANESAALYQRVVDSPIHPDSVRCLDLVSAIFFEVGRPDLAAANAGRSLALSVQLEGFDSPQVLTSHLSLSHILAGSGNLSEGAKHLRAALYLMELLAGPRYAGLPTQYHKLGQHYSDASKHDSAFKCYVESSKRPTSDFVSEGLIMRNLAVALATKGEYKAALEMEKRAFKAFSSVWGNEHEMSKTSAKNLENLTRMAVTQGTKIMAADKERLEKEAADAMASEITAAEDEEKKRKKKKKNNRKK